MKKLLLIAYHYPPRQAVGGLRAAGLAKYLAQFGWEVTILTPATLGRIPSARVIETDYRDVLGVWKARLGMDPGKGLHQQLELRQSSKPGAHLPHTRAVYWIKSWITYPDPTKGWLPFARKALCQLAERREHIDAIVSTAPPISCHLLGLEARRLLCRPWIADCRDMWIEAPHSSRFLNRLGRSLERRTLRKADALITVTAPWADHLSKQYPGKPVASITNGFDPGEASAEPTDLSQLFTITYTGLLYQGRRDPTPLIEVLAELIKEGKLQREKVRVRFFGSADPWLAANVQAFGLEKVVEIHGSVSREQSLRHQRESQILLLLGINIPMYSEGIPGKLFEYLAAKRPILAFGGERGAIEQLLSETGAGAFLKSTDELRAFLVNAYQEFCAQGRVVYQGRETAIDLYSHREMAKKFAQVLDIAVEQQSVAVSRELAEPQAKAGCKVVA